MILSSSVIGEGRSIIILHGLFGESKNWNNIAKDLKSDFEIHLLDQRNHGNSFHDDTHNYMVLAKDLYNYIEKNKLTDYSIIGHSMGGKVAMQFALLYPKNLKNLIIVDITPHPYRGDHVNIFMGLKKILLQAKSRKEAQTILMSFINDMVTINFLLKGLYFSDNNKPKFKFNINAIEKNIDNMFSGLKSSHYFKNKAYFLSGSNSDYINNSSTKYISKLFPLHEIIEIDDAGHWVHFDQKEKFINAIKTILK